MRRTERRGNGVRMCESSESDGSGDQRVRRPRCGIDTAGVIPQERRHGSNTAEATPRKQRHGCDATGGSETGAGKHTHTVGHTKCRAPSAARQVPRAKCSAVKARSRPELQLGASAQGNSLEGVRVFGDVRSTRSVVHEPPPPRQQRSTGDAKPSVPSRHLHVRALALRDVSDIGIRLGPTLKPGRPVLSLGVSRRRGMSGLCSRRSLAERSATPGSLGRNTSKHNPGAPVDIPGTAAHTGAAGTSSEAAASVVQPRGWDFLAKGTPCMFLTRPRSMNKFEHFRSASSARSSQPLPRAEQWRIRGSHRSASPMPCAGTRASGLPSTAAPGSLPQRSWEPRSRVPLLRGQARSWLRQRLRSAPSSRGAGAHEHNEPNAATESCCAVRRRRASLERPQARAPGPGPATSRGRGPAARTRGAAPTVRRTIQRDRARQGPETSPMTRDRRPSPGSATGRC